jgi:hypothetical protein
MSQQLLIHEFSTGIIPEGSEEKWVSKGFTGRYMNMTMPQIPVAVERAIANNGFAVAEGASSDQPAIIGRAIPDSDQPMGWAVVALVTRGKDEYGRSFGFHRYFLCPGSDRLWMLVEWIEMHRSQYGQYPIFNPYKLKEVNRPTVWQEPIPQNPLQKLSPDYEAIPCLIPLQLAISVVQINQLSQLKARIQKGPVSWAYNVEALEQPERFLVIKPASTRAEQILRQPVVTSARPLNASIDIDEQAIKGAIKGLINSAKVNQDLVEVIVSNIPVVEKALNTEAEVTKYWEQLFNGQGAANGVSQNIMTSQMVRLLAIQSIVLPEKLPEYLDWLKIDKAAQASSSIKDSIHFQKEIHEVLSRWESNEPDLHKILKNRVIEGIKTSLLALYQCDQVPQKKSILIEHMRWLLTSKQGLWASLMPIVVKSLGNMLENIYANSPQKNTAETRKSIKKTTSSKNTPINGLIGENLSSASNTQSAICLDESKGWQRIIWNEVIKNSNNSNIRIRALSSFGDLFGKIEGCYLLSACFYQISLGAVPKDVFKHISPNSKPYGVNVEQKLTKFESLVSPVKPYLIEISIFSGFILIAILFYLECQSCKFHNEKDSEALKAEADGKYNTPVSCEKIENRINGTINELSKRNNNQPSKLEGAKLRFKDTTSSSITNILSQEGQNKNLNYQVIADILIEKINSEEKLINLNKCKAVLDLKVLSDGQVFSNNGDEKWIAAIYLYQSFSNLENRDRDGVISSTKEGIGYLLSQDYNHKVMGPPSPKSSSGKQK